MAMRVSDFYGLKTPHKMQKKKIDKFANPSSLTFFFIFFTHQANPRES